MEDQDKVVKFYGVKYAVPSRANYITADGADNSRKIFWWAVKPHYLHSGLGREWLDLTRTRYYGYVSIQPKGKPVGKAAIMLC